MKLALALFTTVAMFGQAVVVERVFTFKNPKTFQQSRELGTCLRSVAEIKDLSVSDTDVTVKGSPGQLAFAEWALSQLDIPPGPFVHSVSADFPYDGNPQDVVRIFRAAHAPGIQAFQEMATSIRSVNEIRRLYTYNATHSIILRAKPGDLDASRWMFEQLDQAATDAKPQTYTIPLPTSPNRLELETTIRVLRVSQSLNVQEFQATVTAVRSITEIRRVYSYSPSKTIIAKGSSEMIDMLSWLVAQLDQDSPSGSTLEYRVPAADDLVNIIFLPQDLPVSDFQAAATRIRTATGIQRFFTCDRPRAVLVRGAASEVAQVRKLAGDIKK